MSNFFSSTRFDPWELETFFEGAVYASTGAGIGYFAGLLSTSSLEEQFPKFYLTTAITGATFTIKAIGESVFGDAKDLGMIAGSILMGQVVGDGAVVKGHKISHGIGSSWTSTAVGVTAAAICYCTSSLLGYGAAPALSAAAGMIAAFRSARVESEIYYKKYPCTCNPVKKPTSKITQSAKVNSNKIKQTRVR